ncbi:flippase [candidate division KSB1 bacterium]|nr:flippase [candidate division KSB1 bacterium]
MIAIKSILADSNRAIFFKGAVGSFAIKFVGAGLLFLSQVALARLCGAEQYGFYAYALSWLTILSILAILGFDTSLLRFIPEYLVKSDWGRLRGIIRTSFVYSAIVSVCISVVGIAAIWFLRAKITAEWIAPLCIMLCALPFYAFTVIRQAALRAFKHVVLAELPESVLRPILLVLTAMLFAHLGAVDATRAWLSQLIAILIAFVLGSVLLLQRMPRASGQSTIHYDDRLWLTTSMPMLLMSSMNIVLSQASIVILGFYRSSEEIAVFSAATRIVILATFILMAINSIAAPMISELYYANKRQELQSILRFSAKGIAVFTTLTSLLIVVLGRYVLSFFGRDFSDGYAILLVLLAGQTIKSFMGPASFLLNLTGHHNLTAKVMGIAVAVCIVLNVVLIPIWGVWGAALASGVTMALWNLTLVIMDILIVRLDPSIFCLLRRKNRQSVTADEKTIAADSIYNADFLEK